MEIQVFSVKQTAEYLGFHERWVRYLAESGRLPARKVGFTWVIGGPDLYKFEKEWKGGKREKE